jgi:hypothetical protein
MGLVAMLERPTKNRPRIEKARLDLIVRWRKPEFESPLAVDAQARAAIMRQVCEHGLGLFRMVPDEQFYAERGGANDQRKVG